MMERDEILRNLNVTINLTETIVKELSSASSNGVVSLKAFDDWWLNEDVNGFRNAVNAALCYTTNHSALYGKFVRLKECSTHALELLGNNYDYVRQFVREFLDSANYYLDNAEPPQQTANNEPQSKEMAQENKCAKFPPIREEVIKGIPPIDFDFNDYELSKWHDAWSAERYGADSLDCSKHYKNYADGDRFITDGTPKEGDPALSLEEITRDRVLELLCKIRHLTRELKRIGLKDFPTLSEIRQKQEERKIYYDEFLAIVQGGDLSPEAAAAGQQATNCKPKPTFATIIQHSNKEQVLERLHGLIDGRRGADVGAVLLKARIDGYLTRNPTQAEFKSEFQLIGTWSSIANYMSDNNPNALDRANKILIKIK